MPPRKSAREGIAVRDWNLLVTVNAGGWRAALRLLRPLARVAETQFYNVLLVHAEDPAAFLGALEEVAARDPAAVACLARVAPVERRFAFSTPEEFEARAREAIAAYAPAIAGRSFHVRIHRRGFKGRLSGLAGEQALAEALLAGAGAPARVTFQDPDRVVSIETVGSQAGVALFSREDLARHPLVRPG
jgi:tRNA(Ser,Leu) C12 N-acetylase TAN1